MTDSSAECGERVQIDSPDIQREGFTRTEIHTQYVNKPTIQQVGRYFGRTFGAESE